MTNHERKELKKSRNFSFFILACFIGLLIFCAFLLEDNRKLKTELKARIDHLEKMAEDTLAVPVEQGPHQRGARIKKCNYQGCLVRFDETCGTPEQEGLFSFPKAAEGEVFTASLQGSAVGNMTLVMFNESGVPVKIIQLPYCGP